MRLLLSVLSMFLISATEAAVVPIKDGILFGFERCKSLSVDLKKGTLQENLMPSFDMHCRKSVLKDLEFTCDIFETSSNKKLGREKFSGGSELGEAVLKDESGQKTIKFLIGLKYASYTSASDNKVCAGIFIFEQDALKQKSSSPKSD